MSERKEIDALVKKHFSGNLLNLDLNYINDNIKLMTMSYEIGDLYTYEYKVSINKEAKEIVFHYHICHCQLERIELEQDNEFEYDLQSILE